LTVPAGRVGERTGIIKHTIQPRRRNHRYGARRVSFLFCLTRRVEELLSTHFYSMTDMASETGKMTGRIKWINEVKTFGLITPDGSSDEVFASFPAREEKGPSGGLSVEQKVSYDLEPGLHGGRAINVAKIA